jgi:hypothetical protein
MTGVVEAGAPDLTRQALRLALSADLTRRATRRAAELPDDAAAAEPLLALAVALAAIAGPVARAHRLTFAPPYPGVTAGVEETPGGARLVLACAARDAAGGAPAAVVFTTLIAGRPPQVTAAPPGAPIPPHWRAPATT